MSVYTGGPYGRLAIMLNTLSSLNIEIIIIIIIIKTLAISINQIFHDFWLDQGLNNFNQSRTNGPINAHLTIAQV